MAVGSACGTVSGRGDPGTNVDSGAHLDAATPGDSGVALSEGAESGVSPAGSATNEKDSDPIITAAIRTALQTLHYDADPPPADPSNRFSDVPLASAFGQHLFFETALSGRLLESDNDGGPTTLGRMGEAGRVSCAGCHIPASDFVDTRSPHRQISLAAQWGIRRTPTLLEVGFAPLHNWDGARDSIWSQAMGVFENAKEFNSGRLFVAQQIFQLYRTEYEAIFGAMPELDDAQQFPTLAALQAGCDAGPATTLRCHGKPGDRAEYDTMSPSAQTAVTRVTVNVAKALAAYVMQLRCGPGRFDRWLDGDAAALSHSEQRGAALFVGRGNCVSCHSGPNLTDYEFHNAGLRPSTVAVAFTDTGDRGAATGVGAALADPFNSAGLFSDGDRGVLPTAVSPDMEGAFRTPTLRCIADQPSFMHTGQIQSLSVALQFFNRGGDSIGYPGHNELQPLGLSDAEQADLVAFLASLQGSGPDAALLSQPND